MKKTVWLISAIMIFVFTGCFVPEKFNASIDVNKDGSYTMTYDGTMVNIFTLGRKLSPKDEIGLKEDAVEIGKDPEVKHIEYMGRGRYKLSQEVHKKAGQRGYLFEEEIKVINVIPRKDGSIRIFVDNMKPKEIQKLKSYGMKIDGKLVISVPKGMKITGSNADRTPSVFGLFGDYEWDINSFEKKIDIVLRPESSAGGDNNSMNKDSNLNTQKSINRRENKTLSNKAFWKEVSHISKLKGDVSRGKEGFALCLGCHMEGAVNMGGVIPPSLDHVGAIYDKNYLIALIKNPAIASNVDHLYKDTMTHPMGTVLIMFTDDQQIADIVAFTKKEKSKKPTPDQAFMEACSRCHAMKRNNITQLGKTPNYHNKKNVQRYHQKVAEEETRVAEYIGKLPPDLSNITNEKSEEYLAAFIKNPQSKIAGTAMPKLGLTKSGFEMIMSYLKGGKGPSPKTENEEAITNTGNQPSPKQNNLSIVQSQRPSANQSALSERQELERLRAEKAAREKVQSHKTNSTQPINPERQELEQLRAEKAEREKQIKSVSAQRDTLSIINWYHPKSEPKELYIVDFKYAGKKKTYRVYCPSGEVRDISNGKREKVRKSYTEDKVRYGNKRVLRTVFEKICL